MLYGNQRYANDRYGNNGAGLNSPNVTVDLSSLGSDGAINIIISLLFLGVNDTVVDLTGLGPDGRIDIFTGEGFDSYGDAGELWKRVPQHSQATFRP